MAKTNSSQGTSAVAVETAEPTAEEIVEQLKERWQKKEGPPARGIRITIDQLKAALEAWPDGVLLLVNYILVRNSQIQPAIIEAICSPGANLENMPPCDRLGALISQQFHDVELPLFSNPAGVRVYLTTIVGALTPQQTERLIVDLVGQDVFDQAVLAYQEQQERKREIEERLKDVEKRAAEVDIDESALVPAQKVLGKCQALGDRLGDLASARQQAQQLVEIEERLDRVRSSFQKIPLTIPAMEIIYRTVATPGQGQGFHIFNHVNAARYLRAYLAPFLKDPRSIDRHVRDRELRELEAQAAAADAASKKAARVATENKARLEALKNK